MAPKLITLLCLGKSWKGKVVPPSLPGAQDELSLSAWPSPLVPLGGRVTLSCHSRLQFVMFTIFQTSGSQIRESYTGLSNHVTINAVTPGHAGTYKCAGIYKHTSKQSAGSKSLNIIVTGLFTKPSISAHPSSLVHAGARVRLCCHSELAFDEFILYKEGNTQHSQQYGKMIQAGHHFSKAVFSMGPITPAHAGAYRCCGSFNHSRYMWSAPSDPLDIVITGKYKKPSLITRENAVVGPGDIVTLFCSSRIPFDKATMEYSRSTFLCALCPQPLLGATDATMLSMSLPMNGQPPVTHCTFLSQESLRVLARHPWNQALKLVSREFFT
uniref:Immunoglobulin domain-containing protein n=1 Tax=Piliocolobus tephrosceles TaxID=591936 RepID=A0A8C9GIA3_9PRIM